MNESIELISHIVAEASRTNYSIDRIYIREPEAVVLWSENKTDSLYDVTKFTLGGSGIELEWSGSAITTTTIEAAISIFNREIQ